jgi:hypothetical protein
MEAVLVGVAEAENCHEATNSAKGRRNAVRKKVFSTRGFIWDLEIALSGVPAKDQPHELFKFG